MSAPVPAIIRDGALRFLSAEVENPDAQNAAPVFGKLAAGRLVSNNEGQHVVIAAIGTTAPKAVRGELLASAIVERGFYLASASALSSPEELFKDTAWHLGVVLSPWKQEVGKRCDVLASSALTTGVVDTVLRSPLGIVGFNTNTWAAMTALEVLAATTSPRRLLLLGSGASARSVALSVGRKWPGCDLVIAARSRGAARAVADNLGGQLLEDIGEGAATDLTWDVVVNTTTWGETETSEAEPFGIDLAGVFLPGGRLFDLNNRISGLQLQALAAGCAVISGSVMQRVTNACRAALLPYAGNLSTPCN